ncbi:hypothetical protein [Pseudocitrobacter corydidari]|uniref:DUF4190 domain-containing protein n=1 Tax=Pseudocitrobacter corydidari TaxID=2891570 RepID=A0ABY3S441_9ENTR|nr:hypothetical protein [Pseudocitrobacter corydidari]UGS40834.1 hypothetical protein G163CM_15330 [Pseudocitrobacter corydidari]
MYVSIPFFHAFIGYVVVFPLLASLIVAILVWRKIKVAQDSSGKTGWIIWTVVLISGLTLAVCVFLGLAFLFITA